MSLKDMIDRIKKTAVADIEKVVSDQGLEKAAQLLSESEKVMDHWQEGEMHGAATAEEVKVGPAQAATGANTGRMNSEYSNNAPQHGVQLDAQKLLRNLSALGASSKANTEAIGHVADTVKSLSAAVTALLMQKAEGEKEEEKEVEKAEDCDGDKEYMEKAAAKAATLIEQAKAAIARAKALRKAMEDMDEEDDKAEMKAARKKARLLTKTAGIALGKARAAAFAAGSVELRKSILDISVKSDVDVLDDDEVNEKDDLGKATEEEDSMEKAKTNDAGNQADHADGANGNQDATAKAVADALSGVKALTTTVNGLMDIVSGKSRVQPVSTAVVKGVIEAKQSITDRIEEMADNDMLSPTDVVMAKSIAQMVDGVAKGTSTPDMLRSRLDKASHAVKLLYADHAAAA